MLRVARTEGWQPMTRRERAPRRAASAFSCDARWMRRWREATARTKLSSRGRSAVTATASSKAADARHSPVASSWATTSTESADVLSTTLATRETAPRSTLRTASLAAGASHTLEAPEASRTCAAESLFARAVRLAARSIACRRSTMFADAAPAAAAGSGAPNPSTAALATADTCDGVPHP